MSLERFVSFDNNNRFHFQRATYNLRVNELAVIGASQQETSVKVTFEERVSELAALGVNNLRNPTVSAISSAEGYNARSRILCSWQAVTETKTEAINTPSKRIQELALLGAFYTQDVISIDSAEDSSEDWNCEDISWGETSPSCMPAWGLF